MRRAPLTLLTLALSGAFCVQVEGQDVEVPPSYQPTPPTHEERQRETAQRMFLPEHPGPTVNGVLGGSLLPPGRTWAFDLHADFHHFGLGAQGTYLFCRGCDFGEDDGDDDDHVGVGYAYAGYSRRNGFVGLAFAYVSGPGFVDGADRRGPGAMLWFRVGRLRGLRFDGGFGFAGTTSPSGTTGALLFHLDLRIPLYAKGPYRAHFGARTEILLGDPGYVLASLTVQVRAGPLLVEARLVPFSQQVAFLMMVGAEYEGT